MTPAGPPPWPSRDAAYHRTRGGLQIAPWHLQGAAAFAVFRAAPPGAARDYLRGCLPGHGAPEEASTALRGFFARGARSISVAGGLWSGSAVGPGARQGCPLSPLALAACMGPLSRALQPQLGRDCLIRTFADDVGVALDDVGKRLPALAAALEQVGRLSGAQASLGKNKRHPALGRQFGGGACRDQRGCAVLVTTFTAPRCHQPWVRHRPGEGR